MLAKRIDAALILGCAWWVLVLVLQRFATLGVKAAG
jgi:hypothetical protein